MKKLMNKKSGFTLIEIIVVLIIVGVLAAIALPNLFGNISKSKGAEALASFGTMKAAAEGCCMNKGGDCSSCTTTTLGLSGNYFYEIAPVDAGKTSCGNYASTVGSTGGKDGYCLRASPGDVDTTNNIVLRRAGAAAPAFQCGGTGTYSGIC